MVQLLRDEGAQADLQLLLHNGGHGLRDLLLNILGRAFRIRALHFLLISLLCLLGKLLGLLVKILYFLLDVGQRSTCINLLNLNLFELLDLPVQIRLILSGLYLGALGLATCLLHLGLEVLLLLFDCCHFDVVFFLQQLELLDELFPGLADALLAALYNGPYNIHLRVELERHLGAAGEVDELCIFELFELAESPVEELAELLVKPLVAAYLLEPDEECLVRDSGGCNDYLLGCRLSITR